jgi:hypothetical protein
MIKDPTMQVREIRHSVLSCTDHLGIKNGRAFDPDRFLNDARVTVGPVIAIDRIETHASIADVDLEPIAVVLELVRPARP